MGLKLRLFRDRKTAVLNSAVMVAALAGWIASFGLMGASPVLLNVVGLVLCAQSMIWAAYLIHEAAHQSLLAERRLNLWAGETASFIAGSSYASFERIRQMHIRHHVDRADLVCFDFRSFIRERPLLRRVLQVLEWAYVPATETLMHLQVIWRPLFVPSQQRHRPRALSMLVVRLGLLTLLGWWSLKALALYFVAYALLLHTLNFFDCFHHSFESHVVEADEPIALNGRDRSYEQSNTYSNLVSRRWPWMNLLILNFAYHNAHHHRASVSWHKLPTVHRETFGDGSLQVLPTGELLRSWHRNRVRRVTAEDYGAPSAGGSAAENFIGAHGVSFLTVV